MTISLSNQLMHATMARFEAERQEAIATIGLYLNASVGVGEHPDIVSELITATKRLADAEEGLATLNRNFMNSTEDNDTDD